MSKAARHRGAMLLHRPHFYRFTCEGISPLIPAADIGFAAARAFCLTI